MFRRLYIYHCKTIKPTEDTRQDFNMTFFILTHRSTSTTKPGSQSNRTFKPQRGTASTRPRRSSTALWKRTRTQGSSVPTFTELIWNQSHKGKECEGSRERDSNHLMVHHQGLLAEELDKRTMPGKGWP